MKPGQQLPVVGKLYKTDALFWLGDNGDGMTYEPTEIALLLELKHVFGTQRCWTVDFLTKHGAVMSYRVYDIYLYTFEEVV
jgi:hypothetical protein